MYIKLESIDGPCWEAGFNQDHIWKQLTMKTRLRYRVLQIVAKTEIIHLYLSKKKLKLHTSVVIQ